MTRSLGVMMRILVLIVIEMILWRVGEGRW